MQLTKHWAATLDDYVIDLAWSPRGDRLAAASGAGPITVFTTDAGAKAAELPGHDDGTNALAWRPDGAQLASGGQDGAVKFWDPAAGQHTGTVKLGTAWIEQLAWRPARGSSAQLAAASGRKISLLSPEATLLHTLPELPKTATALVWREDGSALAGASFGAVWIWNPDTFESTKQYAYSNGIQTLVWSPDQKWLVSGNQDPSVHLWVPAEDIELNMSGYEGKVKTLSFDHTSRWLATGGGRDVCVWDCSGAGPEGREPAMLPHDEKIAAVAFQNQHGLLAAASDDGVLMLWSPERKQPLRATVKMPSPATRLAWSPDDRHLAVGSVKGIVYVLKCEA